MSEIGNVVMGTATGSTTSNTNVVLVTAILTVTAGSFLSIFFSVTTTGSVGLVGELLIFVDGNLQQNVQADHSIDINANNRGVATFIAVAQTAGAHTITGQWLTTNGTISTSVNTTATLVAIEVQP